MIQPYHKRYTMLKKKSITIAGAGLSWMISAINLAREDYDVTIIEAEKQIWGTELYHPSIHITPINKKRSGNI